MLFFSSLEKVLPRSKHRSVKGGVVLNNRGHAQIWTLRHGGIVLNFSTLDEFCFTTTERRFWKIADALFRNSSMTKPFKHTGRYIQLNQNWSQALF
jgi:hypothetical protein